MSIISTPETLLQEALQMSPQDRLFMAEALERSFSQGEFATPEIAAAWAEEASRRADAFAKGELSGEDWNIAFEKMQERLNHDRAARSA